MENGQNFQWDLYLSCNWGSLESMYWNCNATAVVNELLALFCTVFFTFQLHVLFSTTLILCIRAKMKLFNFRVFCVIYLYNAAAKIIEFLKVYLNSWRDMPPLQCSTEMSPFVCNCVRQNVKLNARQKRLLLCTKRVRSLGALISLCAYIYSWSPCSITSCIYYVQQ